MPALKWIEKTKWKTLQTLWEDLTFCPLHHPVNSDPNYNCRYFSNITRGGCPLHRLSQGLVGSTEFYSGELETSEKCERGLMGTSEHRERLWTRQINVIVLASALRNSNALTATDVLTTCAVETISWWLQTWHHTGCGNVSHYQQQSYSGLHSPGRTTTYVSHNSWAWPFSIVPTSLFNLCPV